MSMTATALAALTFDPAVRPARWARVALTGAPGSGKLYTALRLAAGFGGLTGVLDTTRDQAALEYAGLFDFRHLPVTSFDPADLPLLTALAADQGIETLVLHSLSSWWSGPDGMLEQVNRAGREAGPRADKNVGWDTMRPVERAGTDAVLNYPGHVIATLRTKVEWERSPDPDTGLMVTRQVGTKPDARDGIIYDFATAVSMDAAVGTVIKTHCPDLAWQIIRHPGEHLAEQIIKWLADGAVGEAFHPVAVRDWALHPARTLDELRTRMGELIADRRDEAVVIDPDNPGHLISLGILIRRHGARVKAAEQEQHSAAQVEHDDSTGEPMAVAA